MTDHENELERLRKENDVLRGLMPALGAPCVYCGEKDISKCARGFPGCPQADDLMIGQDETGKRLITELDRLRDEVVTLKDQRDNAVAEMDRCHLENNELRQRAESAERLAAEQDKGMQAELDRLRTELEDTYRVLNNTRMTAADAMARVKRQNAAAISALSKCSRAWKWMASNPEAPIAGVAHMDSCIILADTIISNNADTSGSDHISKESVKPLVEALKGVVDSTVHPDTAIRAVLVDLQPIRAALAHAKSLGLPTEKEGA